MKNARTAALLCALTLLALSCAACAEEPPLSLTLAQAPLAGNQVLRLKLAEELPEGLQINAFAGDEQIAASAELLEDGVLQLTLGRPLKDGETILVVAGLMRDGVLCRETRLSFPVESRFGALLPRLRARADAMWTVWQDWLKVYREEGTVYLRLRFRDLPFVTYPDEAPEIAVEEEDGTARVRLAEALPEGWELSFAKGIPVELTNAEWDEAAQAYTGPAGFDSVYLVSPQTAERLSVTVVYERKELFRANYPIVEWIEQDAEEPFAFNCYGFGTARSFTGGMFAIVGNGAAWYADYDIQGVLNTVTDMINELAFDNTGKPIQGDVPEDYVPPFRFW